MATEFQKEIHKTRELSIWFIWIVFLANVPGLINVIHGVVFLIDPQVFPARCEIPGLENSSWNFDQIRNISDPVTMRETPLHEAKIQCYYKDYNYTALASMTFEQAREYIKREYGNVQVQKKTCDKYVAKSQKTSLLIDLELVCSIRLYFAIMYMINAIASIFGGVVLALGDIYGRKRVLIWGANMSLAGGICLCLSVSAELVGMGILLTQAGYHIMKTTSEVIVLEMTKNHTRILVYFLTYMGHLFGYYILYGIHNVNIHWRYMQWATNASLLVLPLVKWYMPESPCWLMSKKQRSKAWAVLEVLNAPEKQNDLLLIQRNDKAPKKKEHFKELIVYLKKYPNYHVLNVICLATGFSSINLFRLNVSEYFEERKTDFIIISNIFYLFQYLMTLPLVYFFGRKLSMIICLTITALFAVLSVTLLSFDVPMPAVMLMYAVSEIFNVNAFMVIGLYALEVVPTTHRCTALGISRGICVGFSNLSLICIIMHANFLVLFILTAVFSSVGIILAFFLKTKANDDLPEDVYEITSPVHNN